jgi:phosphoribosylformylglycinamidine (FGAM) synthase-like enzyme
VLGGSLYLAALHGKVAGRLPRLDLGAEARLQRLLAAAAAAGLLRSAHDVSDGGLAVALAESCILGGIGATVDHLDDLFGEGQSRAVASAATGDLNAVLALAAEHGVPAGAIGRTGGDRLTIDGALNVPIAKLADVWGNALERAASVQSRQ